MVVNTNKLLQTNLPVSQNAAKTIKQKLTIEDINTNATHRFLIDKQLATYLDIQEWCTFKDFTVGLLRFNKKVGDFYCKRTLSFALDKYPFFQRFFPGV